MKITRSTTFYVINNESRTNILLTDIVTVSSEVERPCEKYAERLIV